MEIGYLCLSGKSLLVPSSSLLGLACYRQEEAVFQRVVPSNAMSYLKKRTEVRGDIWYSLPKHHSTYKTSKRRKKKAESTNKNGGRPLKNGGKTPFNSKTRSDGGNHQKSTQKVALFLATQLQSEKRVEIKRGRLASITQTPTLSKTQPT